MGLKKCGCCSFRAKIKINEDVPLKDLPKPKEAGMCHYLLN